MFARTGKELNKSIKMNASSSEFILKKTNEQCIIKLMQSADDIDVDVAKSILVESFISEYEQYLQPHEVSKELDDWRYGANSVQAYYERYFAQEYKKFADKKFEFWVCAYVNGELAGWATFEREKNYKNEVYMDLLIVSPRYQHKGIGGHLVKSLLNLDAIPELSAVHLLLRKKNQGGKNFYDKLGFYDDQDYQRADNFVDLNLLTPLTWKNPALINKPEFTF
ncbi:MAG TPA: GNAT family N-acetyltransferase [Gammaproteobacteria bacterium]|jgi:ribosomal protein S18 acetylase RimI-like enzyme|nr:GNAT family N-acetyltransferase [Gammaproteobacteria bacterium]